MIRLGLCCIFRQQPIRFRSATAKRLAGLDRGERLQILSEICLANCRGLLAALDYARAHGIGAFRILSPLFPRYTHPQVGYRLGELPDKEEIGALLETVNRFRRLHDIRLSFHPDQFVVLSSPRPEVVELARRELEYQAEVAELVGAEVINIHGGGRYGDAGMALRRLRDNVASLSARVRARLTLENDDVSYTVRDLLPVCEQTGLPLVYDVHHHRCNPDGLSEEEATAACVALWRKQGREPWFHISSPKNGWGRGSPKPHADYIDIRDFPACWLGMRATVDVEAKAKELAVLRLGQDLEQMGNFSTGLIR